MSKSSVYNTIINLRDNDYNLGINEFNTLIKSCIRYYYVNDYEPIYLNGVNMNVNKNTDKIKLNPEQIQYSKIIDMYFKDNNTCRYKIEYNSELYRSIFPKIEKTLEIQGLKQCIFKEYCGRYGETCSYTNSKFDEEGNYVIKTGDIYFSFDGIKKLLSSKEEETVTILINYFGNNYRVITDKILNRIYNVENRINFLRLNVLKIYFNKNLASFNNSNSPDDIVSIVNNKYLSKPKKNINNIFEKLEDKINKLETIKINNDIKENEVDIIYDIKKDISEIKNNFIDINKRISNGILNTEKKIKNKNLSLNKYRLKMIKRYKNIKKI